MPYPTLGDATGAVGFVTQIKLPAGSGNDVWLVSLLPSGYASVPAAVYSDNTIRNEAGAVLLDPAGLRQGSAEWISGRQPNGLPWPVKSTDPRDASTTGGVAVGEQPRTDPLFVPGIMPPETVYDHAATGGWGAPQVVDGGPAYASSVSRRDDRWIWPDGRITDAQQTVLGYTDDINQAARELYAHGATPSIRWTGQQVIYSGPAGPSLQTQPDAGYPPVQVDTTPTVVQDEQGNIIPGAPPVEVSDTQGQPILIGTLPTTTTTPAPAASSMPMVLGIAAVALALLSFSKSRRA